MDNQPIPNKTSREFIIPLTKTQIHAFREAWAKEGQDKGAIIAQPILSWGPFALEECPLACKIIDATLKQAIDHLVRGERPPEPLLKELFGPSCTEQLFEERGRYIKRLQGLLKSRNAKAKSKQKPGTSARPKKRRA